MGTHSKTKKLSVPGWKLQKVQKGHQCRRSRETPGKYGLLKVGTLLGKVKHLKDLIKGEIVNLKLRKANTYKYIYLRIDISTPFYHLLCQEWFLNYKNVSCIYLFTNFRHSLYAGSHKLVAQWETLN